MTEQLRESVSALMDGEASELELRRILAHGDRDLIDRTWVQMQTTRSAMHGEPVPYARLDISARVTTALANEPMSSRSPLAPSAWFKPLARVAVAASVTVAVVLVAAQWQSGLDSTAPVQPLANAGGSSLPAYPAAAAGGRAGSQLVSAELNRAGLLPGADAAAARDAQRQLDKYILRHTESLAVQADRGVMPFARVASYEIE